MSSYGVIRVLGAAPVRAARYQGACAMAVIQVSMRADGLALRTAQGERGGDAAARAMMAALHRLPKGAPVAALVHGFRFSPDIRCHDPHDTLFSASDPGGWPHGLGFSPDGMDDGLCIGFGWEARASGPRLFSRRAAGGSAGDAASVAAGMAEGAARFDRGAAVPATLRGRLRAVAARLAPDLGFAEVYARAATVGRTLGALIGAIHAARPDLRVDMLAHSLGARAALHALSAPGAGRAILLGAAEHTSVARALLPAARPGGPEVINVIARHNDLFDAMFEAVAPAPQGAAPGALGRGGLGGTARNWIDLQIDSPAQEAFLAARGIALGAAPGPVCHRGFYERPGAMTLWSQMLRDPGRWSPEALRRAGAPTELCPRWARLAPVALRPEAGEAGARGAAA
jgi:hypothetical protein